jgi:CheY-like chemotaxis protein
LNNTGLKNQRPSELTARFILGIINWIKDIFNSTTISIPRGQVLQHQGDYLASGKAIRYPHILLVEDNPHTAEELIKTIKKYYVFGSVKIFAAYTYDAAETFFHEEDLDLIIMDADLDDEDGDGTDLTQKFLAERPGIPILANSSSRISNLKLTGFGAIDTLSKSTEKLNNWLLANDPTGKGV